MMYIEPMKARSVSEDKLKELWKDPNWAAEEKVDGSRYILWVGRDRCPLISRRKSVTGEVIDKAENVPLITSKKILFNWTLV